MAVISIEIMEDELDEILDILGEHATGTCGRVAERIIAEAVKVVDQEVNK